MTDDPLHTAVCDSAVAWTTGNVGEAFPGVCTPLGWTFVGPTCDLAARRLFHRLGVLGVDKLAVPARVEQRICAPFHGRFAVNVNVFLGIADRMPGMSADEVERQLLGGVRSGVVSQPTRRRYPAIAGRMPIAVARLLPTLRRVRNHIDAWWRASLRTSPGLDPPALRVRLLEARDRFGEVMELHVFVSMLASGAYEQVVNLASRTGDAELAPRLLAGLGSLEEAKLLDDLWDLSRDSTTLSAFLADHGYHGVGAGQISGRPWREESALVLRLAERYRHLPDAERPQVLQQRQAADHAAAVFELQRRLPRWRRPVARGLVRLAGTFVPAREIGKAAFLQTIDVGRDAARRLGATLVAAGHFPAADDIFFLTLDELTNAEPGGYRALVSRRRRQWEEHLSVSLPEQWTGVPSPEVASATQGVGDILRGVPASAGIATGRARVIIDPSDIELEPGDIIVSQTTDPALAGLLTIAGALVTDVGGTLAHAAIVARELGVPCVVNTRTGTTSIVTGDLIEVDGGAGTVRRLS